jgi:dolichyl-diphosphooligosaccharide--protein glycosyltransferase
MSSRQDVAESKFNPKLVTIILLALFFIGALCLRVLPTLDRVFTQDWIKFTGVDAYYHMRLVDNLASNFPHLLQFDPYTIFPGGMGVGSIRFFDWFLAAIIWVIGLGEPSQSVIDIVSVYFPAVLGALTVIPVYFIGKELFGRWAGFISAALLAVMPGEFLGRSILGFTDHHIAETLLTTTAILFLILAIKTASHRQLTFQHIRHLDWTMIRKPLIYSLLAGLFIGLYIFTFLGALIFVFLVFIYFAIQFVIDHLKKRNTSYLGIVGSIFFTIALVMSWLVSAGTLYLVSTGIALLAMPVLSGISWFLASKQEKLFYYPAALIALGLTGLGLLALISPSFLRLMLTQFSIFTPAGTQLATIEMQPILFPGGTFTTAIAWGNFTTSLGLGLIALLVISIYSVIVRGYADKSLLVVWSIVILIATLGQRRFAYYLAVNLAILAGYLSILLYYGTRFVVDYLRGAETGYMSWGILELPNLEETEKRPSRQGVRAERKRAQRRQQKQASSRRLQDGGLPSNIFAFGLWGIIIFFLVFAPNILFPDPLHSPAISIASSARFAPSNAWVSSLDWLRRNTPVPFDDPNSYYELPQPLPRGESYPYPEHAYGVLSWWDYGYWITRIGQRIPNANPSQDPEAVGNVAAFFTSQDQESANEKARELGSAYVIIDHETATSKFPAIMLWAGKDQADFFDVYWEPQGNTLNRKIYLHPEYYYSMSTRLYNFDGKEVIPESTKVISYESRTDQAGNILKVITDEQDFDSYQAAEEFISSQESGNQVIVGEDFFVSPVPLETLGHYNLIHGSEAIAPLPNQAVPAVKVFQFVE